MEESTTKLLTLLKLVGKRMAYIRLIRFLMIGLFIGLLAACIWLGLGRVFPISDIHLYSFIWIAAGLAGGVFYKLLKRIDAHQAAALMDRNGLEDRLSTALNFLQNDSSIVRMQREDAVRHVEIFLQHINQHIPMPSFKKWWLGSGILLGIFLFLSLFPNPMDQVLAERESERQWIEEQQEEVAEMQEDLMELGTPSLAEESLKQWLEQLESGLDDSKEALAALEEMEKSLQEFEKISDQFEKQHKQADQWADAWKEHEYLKQIGESLQNRQMNELQQGIEHLEQEIAKMSAEQKKELAEQLDKLAASASALDENTEQKLREGLQALSKSLAGAAEANMEELNEALAQAMTELMNQAQLQALAMKQSSQIAQMGFPMANQLAAAGTTLSTTWSAGGMAEALADGGHLTNPEVAEGSSGQGAGGESTGGSGSEPGTGSGSGSGTGSGSGAGSGSGSGSAGGTGSGVGSGSGTGGLQGGIGNGSRNLVSTPRTLEGDGSVHSDQGPIEGGGGEVHHGGQSPVIDGASRPYDEVFAEYEKAAQDSINRNSLPQNMQQLVRDYFIEIQPNR